MTMPPCMPRLPHLGEEGCAGRQAHCDEGHRADEHLQRTHAECKARQGLHETGGREAGWSLGHPQFLVLR